MKKPLILGSIWSGRKRINLNHGGKLSSTFHIENATEKLDILVTATPEGFRVETFREKKDVIRRIADRFFAFPTKRGSV